MAKRFSARTLGKFEDASAGIPLRQLNRAFDAVGIRLGQDPGGVAGSRKVQFRRYVASLDQADPQQLARLGAALGSLIDEVATSKQAFLVEAAERDGFSFGDGVFRPAATGRKSFAFAHFVAETSAERTAPKKVRPGSTPRAIPAFAAF